MKHNCSCIAVKLHSPYSFGPEGFHQARQHSATHYSSINDTRVPSLNFAHAARACRRASNSRAGLLAVMLQTTEQQNNTR